MNETITLILLVVVGYFVAKSWIGGLFTKQDRKQLSGAFSSAVIGKVDELNEGVQLSTASLTFEKLATAKEALDESGFKDFDEALDFDKKLSEFLSGKE